MLKKRRKRLDWVQVMAAVLLTAFAVVVFIPFWSSIVVSFQTERDYALHPFALWPNEFTLENYAGLMEKGRLLLTAYKGTLITTILGTLIGMTISVMGAYVFSRKFPGKRILFGIMMLTMFFSGGMVPLYLQLKNMHLLDTYTAVIGINLISVYNIVIMKNGFETVPMELQDAGMIDGANDMQIFAKVMLPLQKPLIATFSLFTIVGYWNNWYWPMLVFNGGDKTVLQLFLKNVVSNLIFEQNMSSSVVVDKLTFSQGIQMATVVVIMLPVMVVYPFLQKYFTKGIMVGAVKM